MRDTFKFNVQHEDLPGGAGTFACYLTPNFKEDIEIDREIDRISKGTIQEDEEEIYRLNGIIYERCRKELGIPTEKNDLSEDEVTAIDERYNADTSREKRLVNSAMHRISYLNFSAIFKITCVKSPDGFDTDLSEIENKSLFRSIFDGYVTAKSPLVSKKKN